MMYAAGNPPTPESLEPLIGHLQESRRDATTGNGIPTQRTALARLGDLLSGMVWPDPAPIVSAGQVLAQWNTVAVSTLLHTQIPDYPIFGADEARGLARLGYDVEYEDDPQRALEPYGRAIEAVKDLRERARWDQVPESHHFLTRIMQTALAELAHEEKP